MYRITSLTTLAALWAGAALAQTDPMAMAHDAAANELGVLEYCQAQGHIDGTAAESQRSVITRLPAYAGSTQAAEDAGKQGNITGNGTSTPLSAMAAKGNTTEAGLCQQMAANVKQAAASNAAAFAPGGVPRIPAMPGGMPAMPAMPGGMPAMPGAVPATPPTQ